MSERTASAVIAFRVTNHAASGSDAICVGFTMLAGAPRRGVYAREQVVRVDVARDEGLRDYPMGKLFRLVPLEEDA